MRLIASKILLLSLFVSVFWSVKVSDVKADGTIYIRADGSIDPVTANITSADNTTYIFTDNNYDSIVVERSNIIVDGAGYTLQGSGSGVGFGWSDINNVTIKHTNIKNFFYGIYLSSSSNNSISGNTITAKLWYGIWLNSSSNSSISGNNVTANSMYGIRFSSSSNNSISGNTITANNDHGIWLSSSSNNSIQGNYITANNVYGIWLSSSSNDNSIQGNTFIDDGLYVTGSYQNSVENNTVNDKPLIYLEGVSNYTIDDAGQVILVRCEDIRIEGLNLSNTSVGVELWETSNSTISGNNITNNVYGIWLDSSLNNSISGNNITANNWYGVHLSACLNNSIQGNNITANSAYGIHLSSSSNNSIQGNNMTANNGSGIYLEFSSNNSIMGNNVTANNMYGIRFHYCSNNSISGNHIANNDGGIYLSISSSSNRVFHNNLISNNFQVYSRDSVNIWDDGYPSGGNYWSNYSGVDSDPDGIGDSQHVIDENNTDNYPLMGMFSNFNTSLGECVNVVSNSSIKQFSYFEENKTITLYASNITVNQIHGFCRVCIPHSLINATEGSIEVIINDGVTTVLNLNNNLYDNGTHRWIYFEYEHSELQIIIVPEFPSLIILPLFMITCLAVSLVWKRCVRCKPK